jgi:2-haloacid dehalogenase
MKFRYLTFDCYGTLVDWREGIAVALKDIRARSGLTPAELLSAYIDAEKKQQATYQKYREVLRGAAVELSASLGVTATAASAEAFASSVPRWPVFPDSRGFLRRMAEDGYQRYILSNVDTDILEETIRRNGLEVDGYVTAEEVGSYKPDRGHWVRFLEKTGASKPQVLHVAQSVFHDIIPAGEMGIASAWVDRYGEPMPSEAQPLFVADSLENLGKALEVMA